MRAFFLVLLALHNGARAVHHVSPLRLDPALTRAAQIKAIEVERCGYRHDACGLPWYAAFPNRPHAWEGENLAADYDTPRALFFAWMNSPHHEANIVRPQFHRVGFACVDDYCVADFSS